MAQRLGRWIQDRESRVRLPARPLPSNNSGQVVHSRVPLSPSSIICYRPNGGDALRLGKGNRRSGVALAMRHRLSGPSTYGLNGQRLGDEHLTYTPEGHGRLYLTLLLSPRTWLVMGVCSEMKETRPESANSRSAWGLDGGDDADVTAFNRQKSTGIDIQSGGPSMVTSHQSMVTSHQALGINDSWLSKFGRGVRCTRLPDTTIGIRVIGIICILLDVKLLMVLSV